MTLDRWLSFSKTILGVVIDSLLTSKFNSKTAGLINRVVKSLIGLKQDLNKVNSKDDLLMLVIYFKADLTLYQNIILNSDDDQFYLENSYDLLTYLVKDLTKLAGEINDKD